LTDVVAILGDVRDRGDAAVREWSERFGDGAPERVIPRGRLDSEALRAVRALAAAVDAVHAAQRPADMTVTPVPGIEVSRRWLPLDSVGLYVPAGLVSTLVMTAVPARLAGVPRIAVATPRPSDAMLAVAKELGIEEIYSLGGAQAIAALAYVHRVDKIVGPGNAFVNEAKLLVSRDVAIDLPAGPSEVVVVLGRGGDRAIADLELAAQREHGHEAMCELLESDDLDVALQRVNELAPEHVVLLGEAESLAPRIRNAGAVFVGASSPVASGDYATGGNHVLPTGRWARSTGGLGLETFLKPVTTQRLTPDGLALVRPTVEALAAVEGMTAHAQAVAR